MKKLITICFVLLSMCFTLTGCESGNLLRTASFSEITMAGSKDYTVKVNFAEDERVDNRYYDIQIRADGDKTVKVGKEFADKKEVTLSKDWKSLTSLLLTEKNTEQFVKCSDAVSQIYIFNSEQSAVITLRVVVGGTSDNSSGKGQIITSAEPCSDEFQLKIN